MTTHEMYTDRAARRFLLITNMVLVGVSGVYSVINFQAANYLVSFSQLISTLLGLTSLLWVGWELAVPRKLSRGPWHLSYLATVIIAGVIAVWGGEVGIVAAFLFVLPPAVMFLATRRVALVTNLFFLGLLVYSFIRPEDTAWLDGWSHLYRVSVLIGYTAVALYVIVISELRHRAYRRVAFLATHDQDTGIPRFDSSSPERPPGDYAVLLQLQDVERIRLEGGNRFVSNVMRVLARRLSNRKGGKCKLSAYSSTSLLMMPSFTGEDVWSSWINGTMRALGRPVRSGGRTISPRLSVVVIPDARFLSMEELESRLETTIQGSAQHRQGIAFYDPTLDQQLRNRIEMYDLLRSARANNELYLAYQPLVDAIDGSVIGAEVLMRWQSAALGAVSPAVFIPVAEETGLIGELTEWMLTRAWHEISSDPSQRFRQLSINVSPAHMEEPDFIERITALVKREGIDPRRISIEITEGILVRETTSSSGVLDLLRELGFSLSIDDFGTGYSNLSYLRSLSASRVKIDRAFIEDIGSAQGVPESRALPLVEAMVFMAKSLGITVLAEGVEREEQAEALRDLGCELFQGYLFGRPEPLMPSLDAPEQVLASDGMNAG